jgi:hypothetical protein
VVEGGEGHLAHSGFLGDADRVLDLGPAPVAQLKDGDVGVFLVGDEVGVAVAGLAVKDRELGAGMGALATADQPCSLGPAGEVEVGAQLRDLSASRSSPSPSTVRPDFYGLARLLCLHLPGVLLVLRVGRRKPHSQEPRGRSGGLPQVLGGSRLVALASTSEDPVHSSTGLCISLIVP